MTASVFKGVIQNVLNRWSGLRLCVEHQAGGRQSKEKALYLVDYINEVLFTNSKVDWDDLEDLIAEYMDNELQTILEDDSVRDVSKAILHFYDLFQSNKHEELQTEINRLPHCDLWLDITYQTPAKSRQNKDGGGGGGSSSEDEEEEEIKDVQDEDEAMDCEWTLVTRKRNT